MSKSIKLCTKMYALYCIYLNIKKNFFKGKKKTGRKSSFQKQTYEIHILELTYGNFKITVIKVFKDLKWIGEKFSEEN